MQKKNLLTIFTSFFIVFGALNVFGQRNAKDGQNTNLRTSPKLVVGIVVDQMRYDYLTRFWNHYGEGGFKRLGPGHASVYSGATPASHGVIGNNWYDKETDKSVYCAADDNYTSVGTDSDAGKMSPHRMNVTTITDELRLHTQMRGKTIAIALKDRGAVLPGGHTANAAYWFQGADEGNWITSSYYMKELPKWVKDFNASNAVEKYKKSWNTAKDINTYVESGADNTKYEGLQDTYIRLDADLQLLLNSLDRKVGKDEYTVFLTADHGAVDVPVYLSDQKIPADYFEYDALKPKFNEFLKYKFGTTDVIKNFSNYQFFLDHKVIKNLEIMVHPKFMTPMYRCCFMEKEYKRVVPQQEQRFPILLRHWHHC